MRYSFTAAPGIRLPQYKTSGFPLPFYYVGGECRATLPVLWRTTNSLGSRLVHDQSNKVHYTDFFYYKRMIRMGFEFKNRESGRRERRDATWRRSVTRESTLAPPGGEWHLVRFFFRHLCSVPADWRHHDDERDRYSTAVGNAGCLAKLVRYCIASSLSFHHLEIDDFVVPCLNSRTLKCHFL